MSDLIIGAGSATIAQGNLHVAFSYVSRRLVHLVYEVVPFAHRLLESYSKINRAFKFAALLYKLNPEFPRRFTPLPTMTSEPEIILYDLACIKNVCFSPVVWRIRLMLNYKNVPYKTIFLEFQDIEPTLKEL